MGIIGSCLPIMRQPLRHCFPGIVGTRFFRKRSGRGYHSDQEDYVLQHRSNRSEVLKDGAHTAWNDASISGPFKSAPRKSDELGIIREAGYARDADSNGSLQNENGIRKDVAYHVGRK